MTWAVCRAQLLALKSDAGALAMSFGLPIVVFLVFAAIFSSTTTGTVRLAVVVADEANTPLSRRLAAAVAEDPALSVVAFATTAAEARGMVARGGADAAVVLRGGSRPLDTLAGDGPSPVQVVSHPARAMAGSIVAGAVQSAYFRALPDAALRGAVALVDGLVVPLSDAQRAEADRMLEALAADGAAGPGAPPTETFSALVETETSGTPRAGVDVAAYYAAAVVALFVLLSAVPVVAALHDTLASGMGDRAVASPAGLGSLVDGRGLFLVLQGTAQAATIFVVAWIRGGAVPWETLGAWVLVALGVALAATGTMLLLAASCRTGRQTTTSGNIAVLIASAVGGSMVPRFLMPGWLQDLGWWTPNAWAIDGFTAAARGAEGLAAASTAAAVLAAAGLLTWIVARALLVRRAVL